MQWISALLISIGLYAQPQPVIQTAQVRVTVTLEQENQDPNVAILQDYLTAKGSPLAGEAATFIEVADQYGLDWTLLPAIAGVESGFERAGNTTDNNPFGYMCSGSPCHFDSYKQGIQRVAKTLGEGKAYARFRESKSVSILAITYNYANPEDWTAKINFFQEDMRYAR